MKIFLIILAVLVVAGGVWYYVESEKSPTERAIDAVEDRIDDVRD